MSQEILPFNLGEIIHTELLKDRRPNDNLLHASSHLTGSVRHAQLDVAGAPKVENPLLSEIVLKTGTMWHEWLHDTLRRLGVPYMAEVNLTPWLPAGWAGTADALIWSPELKAFVLVDFKTTKGEGIKWIRMKGAKDEHVAQASAYWYAAKKMGVPLAKSISILYLPKNDTMRKDELVEPLLVDFPPLPSKGLTAEMAKRWGKVSEYVTSLGGEPGGPVSARPLEEWVSDALAPVQEREQRIYFDKATGLYEVKLMPHWSAAYCKFPDELCDCSTQGTTKIGVYDIDGEWLPRPGYDDIVPTVAPPANN
jgi:hypothetical protein